MSHANNDTYYAKATAVATAGGKVYVSAKAATPDYQETSGPVSASASSADVPFYLYAQPDAGKVFDRWERDGATVSNAAEYTATVTSSSKDEKAPTEAVFTAYFRDRAAVELVYDSKYGTATISNSDNVVGDVVTLTAVPVKITGYGTPSPNIMITFEGWTDETGAVLSTDRTYTFEITEPKTITAQFKDQNSLKERGYYRIRNFGNRVLNIVGNFEVSSTSILTRENYLDGLVEWVCPEGLDKKQWANGMSYSSDTPERDAESLPGTVLYITGTVKNLDAEPGNDVMTNVNVAAQGTDTYSMTKKYLSIQPMERAKYGYHMLPITGGVAVKMTYAYGACRGLIGSGKVDDPYSAMAIQPIDEEHFDDIWFGAAASEEMLFEGGYWTSMYTAFPYECRDGVEAYYVREATTVAGEQYALLEQIEGGRVPAETPVLLKCQGLKSRENRLMPLLPEEATDIPAVEGNLLVGDYSLYTGITVTEKDSSAGKYVYELHGLTDFNPDYMRVLSVNAAGEVGFYSLPPEEDGSQPKLVPNKVWLDMRGMPARSAVVRLSTGGQTGIHEYPVADGDGYESADADNTVYDLYGRRVANPQPGTLYIVGGKKTVFK